MTTAPVTTTSCGAVSGKRNGDVCVFRGIPFARAERFREPTPAPAWTGQRDCTHAGPVAPQPATPLESMLGGRDVKQSEADCLSLNVWTPACDDGRRPVMVWVHGGAFVGGSGANPWYDGTLLAEQGDVVVVTINYRLGALGFMWLGDHDGADFGAVANPGILDQIAALQWVHDNIGAFGGDPSRVTIFGESAGAMSVTTLLATPGANGLFAQAIAQSGAGHHAHLPVDAAEVTASVLAELGLEATDAKRLLDVALGDLLAAQTKVATRRRVGPRLAFQPVIDGQVLPARPVDAVAAGASAHVPLMTGTNLDEWNLFSALDPKLTALDEEALTRLTAALLPHRSDALSTYRATRPSATTAAVWSAVQTDAAFRLPAIRLAEASSRRQPHAYMYLFTWATAAFGGVLGSCHALEIPFVFGTLGRPGTEVFTGPVDERTAALGQAMQGAWLAFAHTGSPATPSLPEWPPYSAGRRATMVLGPDVSLEDDPASAERQLWDDLLD